MGRSLHDDSLRPTRGQGQARERIADRNQRQNRIHDSRTAYHHRGRNYHLNSSQATMLRDVGAFRTITAESLRQHLYQGNAERFKKDLSNLSDHRLVTVQPDSQGKDRYVSLTREGKGVTESHLRSNSNQSVYSGIVKKRELRHDAALQSPAQPALVRRLIWRFSGLLFGTFRILKKNVNRQLAKIQNLSPAERERQRKEIADAHELKIINGKIQIPDVRVEYESREQEQCKVDLECVTGHYKARQIAAKTAAGFKLYNQDYRGRSAERGEGLVGEVISL